MRDESWKKVARKNCSKPESEGVYLGDEFELARRHSKKRMIKRK